MRPLFAAAPPFAVWLVLTAAVAGCTTTSSEHPDKVQTTSQAERENLQGAVAAPLHDLNMLRTKIPQVLLEAMSDPYYRPSAKMTCGDIARQLEPLTMALGPDFDETAGEKALSDKGKDTALGAVAGAASGVIPFRSWVRKLTGAEQHDKYVQTAIASGAVRRAYLKGMGEAHNCLPPAAPLHTKPAAPIIDQELRSRYPTKLTPASEPVAGTPPGDPPL